MSCTSVIECHTLRRNSNSHCLPTGHCFIPHWHTVFLSTTPAQIIPYNLMHIQEHEDTKKTTRVKTIDP